MTLTETGNCDQISNHCYCLYALSNDSITHVRLAVMETGKHAGCYVYRHTFHTYMYASAIPQQGEHKNRRMYLSTKTDHDPVAVLKRMIHGVSFTIHVPVP